MKYFLFLIFLFHILVSNSVVAQVVIGEDPAETAAAEKEKSETTIGPAGEKKVAIGKDDRAKILSILKRMHPDKSVQALNHSLNKYLVDGRVILSAGESKELDDFLATEPEKGFLDKMQDYAMGGNSDAIFAVVDDLRSAFAENPMSLVPKEKVKETLLSQWEGKFIGEMLKNNPRVLEFFATMITDKMAVGKLLDIFKKKSELKYFIVLVIIAQVMMILAFFTLFKQSSIMGRIFKRMLLMLSVNAILLLYFIWRFYPEVSPTINIFHQSFFS